MLQKLRDKTQSVGFKIIVGLLVFALAFFGFGAFNVFAPGEPVVAAVNGEDITQRSLLEQADRERRRLQAALGEDYQGPELDPLAIQGDALEQLIAQVLARQMVTRLNLGASERAVDQELLDTEFFQVEGEFNAELFRRNLSALGFTPTTFRTELATDLVIDQVRGAITDSTLVADWETRAFVRLANQQRDMAWLLFDVDRYQAEVNVSEADIESYYKENQAELGTEASLDAAYLSWNWEMLREDPGIVVEDADIEREYEADKAESDPEQRASSHILLNTGDSRSESEAQAQLADFKARIEAGESFEALAEAHSDDPGSASQGGSLGLTGRGIFVPEFEAALWGLETPGSLSDPVKSEFGYHLIRLDAIEISEYPDLESERAGIVERLREAQARELFAERVRQIDSLAFEQSDSLDGIAGEFDLEPQVARDVTPNMGEAPFDDTELRNAVFAEDVLTGGNNTAALIYGDDQAMVARVIEYRPPRQRTLDEARADIESRIKARLARESVVAASDSAFARVMAGDPVREVAQAHGLAWERIELAGRQNIQAPAEVLRQAFELPRPAAGDKSVGLADLENGSTALVTVTRVRDADPAGITESEFASLRRLLLNRRQAFDFQAVLGNFRAESDISRQLLAAD